MGKEHEEQPKSRKIGMKKLIKKQPVIELVKGERQYNVKPMMEFEKYLEVKSKRYNKYRKDAIKNIVLDKFLIKSAVQNLLTFDKKHQSQDLFQNDGFIYLEIVLNQLPEQHSIRPVQIPLPVPIYSESFNTRSAIFVMDPQRAYKDKIQNLNIPTIAKVIGYEKLKKKYQHLKQKRSLLYTHDLFFCDWRIYNILRKPTGKLFYQRKKFPFPIDCQNVPEWKKAQFNDNYQAYLNDLNNYTYFMAGNGPVYTVKVGRTSMALKDLVKNIIHGVYNTLPHLMSKQLKSEAVRQISIKTSKSPSLPVFNQLQIEQISAYCEH